MTQSVVATKADRLKVNETLNVECFGIPFILTLSASGDPRAVVNVCTHDWIVMDPCRIKHGCFECHKHGVTFDIATGVVRDSKGKNISRGLCSAKAEICNGEVILTVDESHFEFYRQFRRRETVRKLKRLFGRGR